MELTRGDTGKYKFRRYNADGNVIGNIADQIYFTIKKDSYTQEYVLQKTLEDMIFDEDHYYHFTIYPADTDNLDYGTYRYDIEVVQDGNKTTTVGEFIIKEEVTFVSNE